MLPLGKNKKEGMRLRYRDDVEPLETGHSLLHWYALRIYTGTKPKTFIKVDLTETLIHCPSNICSASACPALKIIIYVIKMIAFSRMLWKIILLHNEFSMKISRKFSIVYTNSLEQKRLFSIKSMFN